VLRVAAHEQCNERPRIDEPGFTGRSRRGAPDSSTGRSARPVACRASA
jgi:hypothetical protein